MHCYYPEMNEKAPADTQIEASLGHYGEHYYLRTPLALKGQGITHTKTLTANDFPGGLRAGWHCYRVTTKAMSRLEAKYVVAMAMNLRPTRQFLFRLAGHLKMTVGELERRMSCRELAEWMAYTRHFFTPSPKGASDEH